MSAPIQTLVVDDEPLAREGLRVLLERDPDVELVGECAEGRAALETIRDLEPDLVFLDVQMPEMDGFEVLAGLEPSEVPVVVFVTAYDEYALRAFEVHALDYLLKPFDDERFEAALDRAKSELERRDDAALGEKLAALLEDHGGERITTGSGRAERDDRLMIRSSGRVQFVNVEEIDWVEAAGDYVRLHVGERSHLLRETMKNMEDRLDSERFVRVHRSTLVKLDHVKEVVSSDAGSYEIVLADGTRRSLSRSGRRRLEEVLGRSL